MCQAHATDYAKKKKLVNQVIGGPDLQDKLEMWAEKSILGKVVHGVVMVTTLCAFTGCFTAVIWMVVEIFK